MKCKYVTSLFDDDISNSKLNEAHFIAWILINIEVWLILQYYWHLYLQLVTIFIIFIYVDVWSLLKNCNADIIDLYFKYLYFVRKSRWILNTDKLKFYFPRLLKRRGSEENGRKWWNVKEAHEGGLKQAGYQGCNSPYPATV